jgi:hypothetical protein
MAGAIAHHYNTQLFSVIGNLGLALESFHGGSDTTFFLPEAMGAVRRSSEVSGLMLAYIGQSVFELVVIHLSEMCRLCFPSIQGILQDDTFSKVI